MVHGLWLVRAGWIARARCPGHCRRVNQNEHSSTAVRSVEPEGTRWNEKIKCSNCSRRGRAGTFRTNKLLLAALNWHRESTYTHTHREAKFNSLWIESSFMKSKLGQPARQGLRQGTQYFHIFFNLFKHAWRFVARSRTKGLGRQTDRHASQVGPLF